jgi:hypothetical protein
MTDLAELVIKIDSSQLSKADNKLDSFAKRSARAETHSKRLGAVTEAVFEQLEKDLNVIENKSLVFQNFDANAQKVFAVEQAMNRLLREGINPNAEAMEQLRIQYDRLAETSPRVNRGFGQTSNLLQNIGFMVQDAPFAVMSGNLGAVANNIPAVTDGFRRLSVTAGGAMGAMRMIGGSLLGPTGLILLLGTALPSAIVLAQSGLFDFGKEAEDTEDRVKTLQEQIDELESSFSRFEQRRSIAFEIAGDLVEGNSLEAMKQRLGVMRNIESSLLQQLSAEEQKQDNIQKTIERYQDLLNVSETFRAESIRIAAENGRIPRHINSATELTQLLINEQNQLEDIQRTINALKEDETAAAKDIARLMLEIGETERFRETELANQLRLLQEQKETLGDISRRKLPSELFGSDVGSPFNRRAIQGLREEISQVNNLAILYRDLGIEYDSTAAKAQIYQSVLEDLARSGDTSSLTYETLLMMLNEYGVQIDQINEDTGAAIYLTERLGLTMTSAFEDALVEILRTENALEGLSAVLTGLLTDIQRVFIRTQITEPLLNSIKNSTSDIPASFHGNIFSEGSIIPFAKGGAFTNSIVRSPTLFPLGLMGEGGRPEAIMPLQRTSGGDLGVKAVSPNINIVVNNHTDSEVSFEENRRVDGSVELVATIRRLHTNLLNKGAYDGAYRKNFGIARKATRV